MKNYASARAGRGKTAYRSPSLWRDRQNQKVGKIKIKNAILIVKNEFKYVTFYREGAGNIKPAPYEKSKEIEEKSKELTKPKRK